LTVIEHFGSPVPKKGIRSSISILCSFVEVHWDTKEKNNRKIAMKSERRISGVIKRGIWRVWTEEVRRLLIISDTGNWPIFMNS
jgi:hypothetical protein